jgi:hypothetical protein
MSTGAECHFYEKTPQQWFYDLQQWPYGESEDYNTFGPFTTFEEANTHLDRNHANPGGYSVSSLPNCPHDITRKRPYDKDYPLECRRCGDFLSLDKS